MPLRRFRSLKPVEFKPCPALLSREGVLADRQWRSTWLPHLREQMRSQLRDSAGLHAYAACHRLRSSPIMGTTAAVYSFGKDTIIIVATPNLSNSQDLGISKQNELSDDYYPLWVKSRSCLQVVGLIFAASPATQAPRPLSTRCGHLPLGLMASVVFCVCESLRNPTWPDQPHLARWAACDPCQPALSEISLTAPPWCTKCCNMPFRARQFPARSQCADPEKLGKTGIFHQFQHIGADRPERKSNALGDGHELSVFIMPLTRAQMPELLVCVSRWLMVPVDSALIP